MSAQFYLSLLNPILALSFSAVVALLWHRWPTHTYFFPLSIAFLYLGLGFISQEWPLFATPGSINFAGNAFFFAAVLLACVSALIRVKAGVPIVAFAVICLGATAWFLYFAFVVPSTTARIMTLSGGFVLITLVTLVRLTAHGLVDLADRLIATGVALGAILAGARPLLLLTGVLQLNADGGMDQSTYWGSVAGLTPLLAIFIVTLFVFSLVLDITRQLRREADHDLLTGLYNRRGFETAVTGVPDATGFAPALLSADIDDFKQVNDQHGHAVGDRVIATVGAVLSDFGEADFVGRIGGEEFALFYRNASLQRLEAIARKIASALEARSIEGLPPRYPLTISIGLHVRQAGESLDDMLVQADRALYRAKADGKNRAVASRARLKLA